ncbi:MAG: HAMP domain-containing histidine kinase [Lachnospiraceae bacterium]|jgi:signal transduction histidine kinase|nr:HAMP domain-containing histidine kinase [Lachnospiraceae bacterium]
MNKLIIKAYLKEHTRYAFAYGLGILILFSLAGLYEYDRSVRNMSYGLIIIAFFAVVYGIYDFIRYKKKCLELMDTALAVGERDYHLPDAGCLPEHIYQKMVHEEARERRRVVSEYDEKRGDMADYYTMWIHQIKTPIAAMRLLLEDRADGTGLLAGQQAAEELFKIEQYAEMALCYARLDSLSSDLLFKKYNVYGILKQAVKKYAVLFIGSGLSFSMEEFAVQAVTDEKWLAFVLEQILSNAIKYTKKGGISIYGADCAGDRQEGEVSYLVIEDSGIGIRKEDLPRIFERGFTGCNGRLEKRSTGIGLYLSRQILDRLSHTIRVESEVGKGTKVILGFVQPKYD